MVMFLLLAFTQSALNLSNSALHCRFIGANTATSKGCVKCVELGGRKMYLKQKLVSLR